MVLSGRSAFDHAGHAGLSECSAFDHAGHVVLSGRSAFDHADHVVLSGCFAFDHAGHVVLSECFSFDHAGLAVLSECSAFDHAGLAVLLRCFAFDHVCCFPHSAQTGRLAGCFVSIPPWVGIADSTFSVVMRLSGFMGSLRDCAFPYGDPNRSATEVRLYEKKRRVGWALLSL